jgi:DNA-binding SARP family transcriptional activator
MTTGEFRSALPVDAAALMPFTRHPLPAVRLPALEALERPRSSVALEITLLGGFSVTRGNRRADDAAWERRVAQRLVRFLLLHRNRTVNEDELLETFWPYRRVDSARRSLHVATSRARHVLDTPASRSVIDATDRVYRLRLRPDDVVDADRFEMIALAALGDTGISRLRLLEAAASLWAGEPLPEERYTDWAVAWRERLCDLHVGVLVALTDEYLRYGDLVLAGRRAAELVERDPLNEGAHRRLMVAHARAGRRGRALRQFLDCRRALVGQLGIEPSCETACLQQRILSGERV